VKITNVHSNHARAEEIERLPMDEEESDGDESDTESEPRADRSDDDPRLGSRDNFWG
jgi:hypothetical protein